MSWRTVVVSRRAKLDMKMGFLVVRSEEETKKVHLDEISVLILENTAVSITGSLISALSEKKIKVISKINFYIYGDEEKILTLVFENQHLFYDIVSDISMQLEGQRGNFVLSEDYQPLDIRKHIELVTQFVPFNINQKELINKLYSDLKNKATDANFGVVW